MLNGVELVVEARLKYFKVGLCWLSQLAVTEELESGDINGHVLVCLQNQEFSWSFS